MFVCLQDEVWEYEVIANGFERVLTTKDGQKLRCIVNQKLKHPRNLHLSKIKPYKYSDETCELCFDEMLSSLFFVSLFSPFFRFCFVSLLTVILYTGCDCYSDLRSKQRNGDVETWKIFDATLNDALLKLRQDPNEPKISRLYSGMKNVGIDAKNLPSIIQLDTFTSFSWDANVAYQFAGFDGCILKLDLTNRTRSLVFNSISDVSWISKFEDEKEFLATRRFEIKINLSGIKWEKMKNGQKVQIVPCE